MITPVKRFLQNFFGLSRTETNGFLILLPLLLAFVFSEPIYAWWIGNRQDDFSSERATLDSLTSQWKQQVKTKNEAEVVHANKVHISLFFFDPNNSTAEQLRSLGFAPKLASRVIHFREKGGTFKIKSDLLKIYGMDNNLYQRVQAYIRLPDRLEPIEQRSKFASGTSPTRDVLKIDLNDADTTQLQSIYGIGSKLSARIVKYRQRLGGFVSLDQLTEVYGLDSAVVNRLRRRFFVLDNFRPHQININKASEKDMGSHPYMTRPVASAIAAYRFQHGNFKEVDDLHELHLMKDEMIEKISPYLTFDE